MSYVIYFDESNKLDQPGINYSYYGALGMHQEVANDIRQYINHLNETLKSKSEMHFVEYTQDTNFEKYFRALHYVLSQPIQINLMIVNKQDAEKLTSAMDIKMAELRELF